MTKKMFDDALRAVRRARASRTGAGSFLHDRAFEEVLDRLSLFQRRFRSAAVLGCIDPAWGERLLPFADRVQPIEDELALEPGSADLCVSIGTLDTSNDLPRSLLVMRFALRPGCLLIGAVVGGDTLPRLASAMRAADAEMGAAAPHMHPRLDPSSLAGLLSAAGFEEPVVDIDRVQVSYGSLWDLVRDLRAMGATNMLADRPRRPLTRAAARAAAEAFSSQAEDGRVIERFELLHFAAWTPADPASGDG